MNSLEIDVVVAGGGTAGVVAALAAARSGATTALIEAKGYTGGLVVEGGTALHKARCQRNARRGWREHVPQYSLDGSHGGWNADPQCADPQPRRGGDHRRGLLHHFKMPVSPTDRDEAAKAEAELRQRQGKAIELLRRSVPGCEKAFISQPQSEDLHSECGDSSKIPILVAGHSSRDLRIEVCLIFHAFTKPTQRGRSPPGARRRW